jgi:methionyl-tRNA formyltransferase
MDRSVELVDKLVRDAERGSIPRRPQPEGTGAYFSSTADEDFRLRWDWPAEKLRRYITITPGKCCLEVNAQRVFFHNAETGRTDKPAAPGTLLQVGRTRAVVAAGQGTLSSSSVQAADRDAESFAGFCRRVGLQAGDRLAA